MMALDHLLHKPNWPLALARYDRGPLSDQEVASMETVLDWHAQRKVWFSKAHTELTRLVTPVVDALNLLGVAPKNRNTLVSFLLERQLESRQIFWDWSDERWIAAYQLTYQRRQQRKSACSLNTFLNTAYLLVGWTEFDRHEWFDSVCLAHLVFGDAGHQQNMMTLTNTLVETGFRASWCQRWLPREVATLCLKAYSLDLAAITLDHLRTAHDRKSHRYRKMAYVRIAFALQQMGLLSEGLDPAYAPQTAKGVVERTRQGIAPAWLEWVDRWTQHSRFAPSTRRLHYQCLLQVGRWLVHEHPSITTPDQWTRDLTVTFVAAVDRLKIGDWAQVQHKQKHGQPVSAHTKSRYLAALRSFFYDLQEWEWIPRRFDPQRCLAVPRSVQGLLGPQPKPIDPAIWKKLVITALNLTVDDLPDEAISPYPLPLVKAIAAVWVFSGLRPDEIWRLRTHCIQFAGEDTELNRVCWLEVPANKQNPAFTKPVDLAAGKAITAWEAVRPLSPSRIDPKTGQTVDFLFDNGGYYISRRYVARTLIPLLCRAAGVPETDSLGPLTPNRARHTIAYQLANGRDPMPLLELQVWMGHKSPDSTMHYTSRTPLELSRAIEHYVARNTRLVTVLVDRAAIENGEAANGEPWKYYDVGPGYCTNDFFETCPHRLACAHCASYVTKQTSQAQWQQTQTHLLRIREAIPLTNEMLAAIDDGLEAVQGLLDRLADTPALSGETPRDLGTVDERQLNLIRFEDIPVL